jgi:uncharacterized protein (DUF2384 family)
VTHQIEQAAWQPVASRDEVFEAAERRYGEEAEEWLARPLPILGGLAPADLLYTARGRLMIMRLLDRAHRW